MPQRSTGRERGRVNLAKLSLGLTAWAAATGLAHAAAAQSSSPATAKAAAALKKKPTTVAPVRVFGRREDTPAKLDHILPEVAGAKITVTKKTTITKLDEQPAMVSDNERELFARIPGLLVSEQQTPTQFNFSYRGLGNPQESEYVLVMQDGVPINTDWIGFPTLYYVPLPQSISTVEELRAGSSLLYGPEPAPVINFVSRSYQKGAPTIYGEEVAGSDGLLSSYNAVQGAAGRTDMRADAGYVSSDGQRQNSQSFVRQTDLSLGFHPSDRDTWRLDLMAYDARSGDPGRIGYAQFRSNPDFSPTPYNEDWVSRYAAVLSDQRDFGHGWRFEGKVWAAYQDLASRSAANIGPGGAWPTTTTLQDEIFRSEGADLRLRDRWGRGNAFTIGLELYRDDAPFRQWTSAHLLADRSDHSGVPRLRQKRRSEYASLFGENLIRLPGRFHLVTSVRLEHEHLDVDETVRPPFLTRPLLNVHASRDVPLFGFGVGNDFGRDNETYFNVTQGWRPLRFFDVASPFANTQPGNVADPSRSLTFEGGVHGTPATGLYYDVSLYWIEFKNRIETIVLSPTDSVNQNSGATRNRGFEGEIYYDFLARQHGHAHLTAFASLALLDTRFVSSDIPGQVGKVPAFAPHVLAKYGLIWRLDDRRKLSFTGVSVSSQFFQDSDLPFGSGASFIPAKVGGYTVLDLTGEWKLTNRVSVLAGVYNLGDVKYYSRVFQNGIEPAPRRSEYVGLTLGF